MAADSVSGASRSQITYTATVDPRAPDATKIVASKYASPALVKLPHNTKIATRRLLWQVR